MELSKIAASITASPTLALDAKEKRMRAEGIDVVGFCAGQPDFDTPVNIKQAAIKAINDGFTKYTPAAGDLELQKAICRKFKRDNGLDYSPSDIVVSNGAKHSLMNAFQALCNPGDEVIIPGPYWVSYPEMVKMTGAVPVFVAAEERQGFKVSVLQLKKAITAKTKAIIVNSPSNPTGMIYSRDELQEIADLVSKYRIYIVSDEIYEKLVYDSGNHTSIAALDPDIKDLTIVVNGVSKTYAMTGWRIGFTASNAALAKIMGNIQSHATSNPNSIAQKATIEALDGPQDKVAEMVHEFEKRRDYIVNRINAIRGLSCLKPMGAFYVMMNISGYIGKRVAGCEVTSADTFAEILLEKARVAAVPGTGFGTPIHVRLSYATSMKTIEEGMNRLDAFVNS